MKSLRTLACGICIFLFIVAAEAAAQQRNSASAGIDAETIAAFEKLGATYGGLGRYLEFKPRKVAAQTGLPAFCFPGGPPAPLTDPGVPFGLHVGYYRMNQPATGWVPKNWATAPAMSDAGMKNLKELKNLDSLYLYSFGTTDEGMKELASLKKLRRLYLVVPLGVTDAGLKVLGRLDNLSELSLSTKSPMRGLRRWHGSRICAYSS